MPFDELMRRVLVVLQNCIAFVFQYHNSPAVGKEQTTKGGVLYEGDVQPLAISRLPVMSYLTG